MTRDDIVKIDEKKENEFVPSLKLTRERLRKVLTPQDTTRYDSQASTKMSNNVRDSKLTLFPGREKEEGKKTVHLPRYSNVIQPIPPISNQNISSSSRNERSFVNRLLSSDQERVLPFEKREREEGSAIFLATYVTGVETKRGRGGKEEIRREYSRVSAKRGISCSVYPPLDTRFRDTAF